MCCTLVLWVRLCVPGLLRYARIPLAGGNNGPGDASPQDCTANVGGPSTLGPSAILSLGGDANDAQVLRI